MYLSEFRVYNYKSFLDSGPITLKPGINVLTGQNNAGKTALLEALGLQFQNKPHRGLVEGDASGFYLAHQSHVFLRVAVTKEEWSGQGSKSGVVIPVSYSEFADVLRDDRMDISEGDRLWYGISNCPEIQFEFVHGSDQNDKAVMPANSFGSREGEPGYLVLRNIQTPQSNDWHVLKRPNPEATRMKGRERPAAEGGGRERLGVLAGDISTSFGVSLKSGIYSFRAERLNVGRSQFGNETRLQSDASNLPQVLNVLQSTNPARFQRYNRLVKRVFPQVEWISVRPVGNNQVEILVWSVDPETERADLSVPLSESGTGIGQVLAMLYVLVTAETPRTILIDEPNSFLHPGAVRVLVEILREHPQHQYILSTHSPELIAASNPSTIHILRRSRGVTQVESVDTQEARQFRTLLMEVGSRPSDVFGAENVLWVEGPTEQLCFPLIARHFLRRPLAGVSIVGVLHTGDFDAKKDTRSVFRIYERLTQGSALLPPAIAFIFDREIRPDKDRQDLERQSKGKVHFLSRRTYENHLLHAGALAAVMNEHPPFTEAPIHAAKVQTWLDAHCRKPEYYGKAKSHDYPRDIDAPKLLEALFGEFSENRLTYNKVEHSLELTEWLLAHAPEELKEIGELLGRVLPPAQT